MADFGVSFIIQGKHLGDLMEVLQPFKVQGFDMKVVAGTPTKIRQGDAPAWQVAAAAASKTPQRAPYFTGKLKAAGFRGNAHAHLKTAVQNGVLRRVKVKGVTHYARTAK